MTKALAGRLHAHGCVVCSKRYADACRTPRQDDRCTTCRGGQRPSWDVTADPVECCRTASRRATRAEVATYALAGASAWWRCATCSRTHPFDPTGGNQ